MVTETKGFALQDSFSQEDVPDARRCLIRKMLEVVDFSDSVKAIVDKWSSPEEIFSRIEEESIIGVCLFSQNQKIAEGICDNIICPSLVTLAQPDAKISEQLSHNIAHYFSVSISKIIFGIGKFETDAATLEFRQQIMRKIVEHMLMAMPALLSTKIGAEQMRILVKERGWATNNLNRPYVVITKPVRKDTTSTNGYISYRRMCATIWEGEEGRITYFQLLMLIDQEFILPVIKKFDPEMLEKVDIDLWNDLKEFLDYFSLPGE
jgi:hypothetical protein